MILTEHQGYSAWLFALTPTEKHDSHHLGGRAACCHRGLLKAAFERYMVLTSELVSLLNHCVEIGPSILPLQSTDCHAESSKPGSKFPGDRPFSSLL
jgi:hypothetical protein